LNTQEASQVPDTFPRDELSVSDIAQLALVGPSAVSNWQKRYDDFPKPIDQDGRWHRFRTGDVLEWLKDHGRMPTPPEPPLTLEDAFRNSIWLLQGQVTPTMSLLVWAAYLASEIKADDDRLQTVIRETLAAVPPSTLSTLSDHLDRDRSLATSSEDVLCTLLYLLEEEFGDSPLSENHTSPELASLIANLFEIDANGEAALYDPCCGTGRTLIRLGERHPGPHYYGQEINKEYVLVSRLLLALESSTKGGSWDVGEGDSLRDDAFPELRADYAVVDPPFGVRISDDLSGDPRWILGEPGREGVNAWIQVALSHLNDTGVAAIVVEPGWAFRKSAKHIRSALIRQNLLDAVIALPTGTFCTTNIGGLLLVLAKDRSTREHPRSVGQVLMITAETGESRLDKDASKLSKVLRKEIRPFRGSPESPINGWLARFAPIYRNWRNGEEPVSELVVDAAVAMRGSLEAAGRRPDGGIVEFSQRPAETLLEGDPNVSLNRLFADQVSHRPPTETRYEDITEHDFDLTPRRYISSERMIEAPDFLDHLRENRKVMAKVQGDAKKISKTLENLAEAGIDLGERRSQHGRSPAKQIQFECLEDLEKRGVLELVRGFASISDSGGGGQRLITGKSLRARLRAEIDLSEKFERVTKPVAEEHLIKAGDVIFTTLPADQAAPVTHIAKKEEVGAALSRELCALRITDPTSTLTPEFLADWTKTRQFSSQVDRLSTGSTMRSVSRKDLLRFEVPIPEDVDGHHDRRIQNSLLSKQISLVQRLEANLRGAVELEARILDAEISQAKAALLSKKVEEMEYLNFD
tara:strand:+ start:1846 stop:4272 length:2427 start_codon:yes stop_codon:yes gene_type:complete